MDINYLRNEFRNVLSNENLDVKTGEDIIYIEQVATNGYGMPKGINETNCKQHYSILKSANFLKMRQKINSDSTGMNDFRRSIVQERLKAQRKDIENIINSNQIERTYIILFGTLGSFSLYGYNHKSLQLNDYINLFDDHGFHSQVSLYDVYSELLCCGKLTNIPKITRDTHYILRVVCEYATQDVLALYEEFEKIGIGFNFVSYNTRENSSTNHVIPLYEMLLYDNLLSFVPSPHIKKEVDELLIWDFIKTHSEMRREVYSNSWPGISTVAPFIAETKGEGLTSGLLPEFSDKIADVTDIFELKSYCEKRASKIAHKLLGKKEVL